MKGSNFKYRVQDENDIKKMYLYGKKNNHAFT